MSQPHRCPVCLGHGNVPGGFYACVPGGTPTSTNVSERCRACKGTGIIWAQDRTVINQIEIEEAIARAFEKFDSSDALGRDVAAYLIRKEIMGIKKQKVK